MPRPNNLILHLLLLYAAFIIYATIIPFAFDTPPENFNSKLQTLLSDPLQLEARRGFSITDVVSNVLLFLPFGVLFALAYSHAAPSAKRTHVILWAVGAALPLSALVEFMQFFSERRVAYLLDCLMNGTGAFCGAFGVVRFTTQARIYLQGKFRLQSFEAKLFAFYAALLAFVQLLPLRPTLDVSTIKQTLKAIEWSLPQTPAALGDLWAETILYAGLSFLWLRQRKHTQRIRFILQALGLTVGAALLLETLQIFFVGHVVRLCNLLAGFEGGLYGAICFLILTMQAARRPQSERARFEKKFALNLALGHLPAFVLLLELKPYHFNLAVEHVRAQWAQFHALPFIEYYQNTNAHAVVDFSTSLAQFALLAILFLARTTLARSAQLVALYKMLFAIVLGLSMMLEALQLTLPRHITGSTDCVNALLGTSLGIWIWQKYFSAPPPHFKISSQRRTHAPPASTHSRPIMR